MDTSLVTQLWMQFPFLFLQKAAPTMLDELEKAWVSLWYWRHHSSFPSSFLHNGPAFSSCQTAGFLGLDKTQCKGAHKENLQLPLLKLLLRWLFRPALSKLQFSFNENHDIQIKIDEMHATGNSGDQRCRHSRMSFAIFPNLMASSHFLSQPRVLVRMPNIHICNSSCFSDAEIIPLQAEKKWSCPQNWLWKTVIDIFMKQIVIPDFICVTLGQNN